MEGDRALCLLADSDQWARCRHENTALMPCGGVQLTWDEDTPIRPADSATGLAFDRWGRAYRSRPAAGRVDVIRAERTDPLGGTPGLFTWPRGLAVDGEQRLYVVESGVERDAVTVYDIWADRVLRRVPVARPVDVTAVGGRAYVLVHHPDAVVVLLGRRDPTPGPTPRPPRCRGRMTPYRIAARPDGSLLVLWREQNTAHAVVATLTGEIVVAAPEASDFAVTAENLLVVARAPGRPFQRFGQCGGGRWQELEPVAADGYDGGAVAAAPDGTVAFTTDTDIGRTGGARAAHRSAGRVVTYRLDSGAPRTRWGRLFLDACIPPRTDVRVGFVTSDDDEPPGDPLPWLPADRGSGTIRRPDLTPPLPSGILLDAARAPGGRTLLRRPTGREGPWAQIPAGDRYETYETPVIADPGRYLWVVLELSSGTAALTPRVRALRVERPGHQLLRQLPRTWSRDDGDADFLQRFLAPAEGMLHELDERAARRELLVDPSAVPQEALQWLASFAGLTLDRRWPENARRTLIASAYRLFRRRGTLASLTEMLGIYLGREPVIMERWRLRGVPGGVLGGTPGGGAVAPVLGRIRVGGTGPGEDGYRTAAHRFTVLVHTALSAEQLSVVRTILDLDKPAHTLYDICELGCGMRVGRQAHLGLTAVVGPGAGWGPAIVGQVAVGGDGIVGIPAAGARVHQTSRVGEVRVG
ncbi:phage tail protein [Streptomyces sp. NPDC002817]|uniref:phage tail protein n=1 Tax=Streptomyces sp. NPDC088357 TaxID=3154655 RepID=UPI00341CCCAF